MRSKVQKWGNSLAVRIPKPFAEDAGLSEDADIELVVREGSLVMTPTRRKLRLAALLRKVTPESIHAEVETGEPTGREAW